MTENSQQNTLGPLTTLAIEAERHTVTTNYHPLPVVLAEGDGAWVTDVDGVRYLDALSGYSAVNFGHSNPRIVAAAQELPHEPEGRGQRILNPVREPRQ